MQNLYLESHQEPYMFSKVSLVKVIKYYLDKVFPPDDGRKAFLIIPLDI